MLTARGVYVVRYPTLSNGLVVHKPTRPLREVECVGLREERGVGLRDWCLLIITGWPSRLFLLDVLLTYCPTVQHNLVLLAWAKLSSTTCGQGVVGSMPAQPGIQSVIRGLVVTNYWASLNSVLADGQFIQDTVEPSCLPENLTTDRQTSSL